MKRSASSKPEPNEYGVIGYAWDVVDLDLPEGQNILWTKIETKQKSIGVRMRVIREGEKLV